MLFWEKGASFLAFLGKKKHLLHFLVKKTTLFCIFLEKGTSLYAFF